MVKVTDVETFWSPELPLTAMVKVRLGVSVLVTGWWLLPVPPQETRLHVIKASTSSQAIPPTTFTLLTPPATATTLPLPPHARTECSGVAPVNSRTRQASVSPHPLRSAA